MKGPYAPPVNPERKAISSTCPNIRINRTKPILRFQPHTTRVHNFIFMKSLTISSLSATVFAWLLTLLGGTLLFDTFVLYPNIFHNVPDSLAEAKQFLRHGSPSTFFKPFGSVIVAIGVMAIVFNWWSRPRLFYLITSFILLVAGDFLFSASFFWPRNHIMFNEGITVHSSAFLKATALEFQNFHWIRVGVSIAASAIALAGVVLHGPGKKTLPLTDPPYSQSSNRAHHKPVSHA